MPIDGKKRSFAYIFFPDFSYFISLLSVGDDFKEKTFWMLFLRPTGALNMRDYNFDNGLLTLTDCEL